MDPLGEFVGETLRRARLERGFTLRRVQHLSNGRFKPSSLAGYERAERKISLESFLQLAKLYGVPADRLLQAAMENLEGRRSVTVDLTLLPLIPESYGKLVGDLVHRVRSQRSDTLGDTITLRAGDLEELAMSAHMDLSALLSSMRPAVHDDPAPARGLTVTA